MIERTGSRATHACALVLAGAFLVGAAEAQPTPPDADMTEVNAALDDFKAAYRGDDEAKAKAIDSLAALRHPGIFAALKAVLLGPGSAASRQTAARALGRFQDRRVAPALKQAFEALKKDPEVLEAVIQAIGTTPDPALALLLRKYLDSHGTSFDAKIIGLLEPTAEALGKHPSKENIEYLIQYGEKLETIYAANVATGSALPPGIVQLSREQIPRVRRLMERCRGALKAMTGEDPEPDDRARLFIPYRRWWKLNEKTWRPPATK